MQPSLEKLELLNVELPAFSGSHPFSKGQNPKFYKELLDTAEGVTARTHFFEKNLVGLYLALERPVPYAFRTKDNTIRSLDAGCVKFLYNRRPREIELVRDSEGYIVAVEPLVPMLERFDRMRDAAVAPYTALARSIKLPFDISDPVDERRRADSVRVVRDGAAAFRDGVLQAWGRRCAISRTGVVPVLEAAHIFPYLGVATNDFRNAILLKSDLHTLFDLHLLSFEYIDERLFVRISKTLEKTGYAKYDARLVKLPSSCMHCPDPDVVHHHFEKFRKRERGEA
ncbi:HNH endonuclease [uncultured Parvibaculum sp.]|uniref:HNH endonuclease n=1 Tax=uncultured Parvibaculum sp. TaxID=291828 RepID=UPI0030ED60DF